MQAWSTTPAMLLACEMLFYFSAFRRITTDTRSAFLFPHFVQKSFLDKILLDFPELNIIAAHLGHGWERQLNSMAVFKFNLMTDISARQLIASQNYDEFCHILRSALDDFGPQRVLFGTDGPMVNPIMRTKDYLQLIKELPDKAPSDIAFTKEEVDAMLGQSAFSLLCS